VLNAGFKFTMEAYKKNRAKRGLPVPSNPTRMGRPRLSERLYSDCQICKKQFVLGREHDTLDLEGKICHVCGVDYARHTSRGPFKEQGVELTVDWYILLRTKVPFVGLDGVERTALSAYSRGPGRPKKSHVELVAEDHERAIGLIKQYKDPEVFAELLGLGIVQAPIPRKEASPENTKTEVMVPCLIAKGEVCTHYECLREAGYAE
jgi:hypothetical protein